MKGLSDLVKFEKELKDLINKHGIDSDLNVNDDALAASIISHLMDLEIKFLTQEEEVSEKSSYMEELVLPKDQN